MTSFEKPSSAKSKSVPTFFLDSTHEPSPEPQTLNERLIHPLKFPIRFKDYGNTSKISWHEKNIRKVSSKMEPSKEWLMKVKHSSEAIQILSPSITMPCSLRGTNIEVLHNPTVGTSIMSEFLAKNLLDNMPLVLTNKLFQSPLGLFFECCGIVRTVLS